MVFLPRCKWHRLAVLSFLSGLFLASCSISDRVSYADSEAELPEDFLSQVKPNKTSKEWVTSRLSEPKLITEGPLGQEVYTYDLTRRHYRRTSIFFIIRYSGVEEDESYLHVLFKDGLVKKRWYSHFSKVEKWRFLKPKKKVKPSLSKPKENNEGDMLVPPMDPIEEDSMEVNPESPSDTMLEHPIQKPETHKPRLNMI